MKILSIDIGLFHLGLIEGSLSIDYLTRQDVILEKEIILCDLVDITELINDCKDPDCELYHDKIICDSCINSFCNSIIHQS